jgi:hypothetical protein
MSYDYSCSLEGVRAAWRTLDRAAHRIAAGSVGAQHVPPPGVGKDPLSGGEDVDTSPAIMRVDLAGELWAVGQAKIEVKANLKVMSVERELERDTLDILA